MSKGKEAGGRPRTLHAATNEEEVEKFVLKEYRAGNASQPATGFQDFTENRFFPNISFMSPVKPKGSLKTRRVMTSVMTGIMTSVFRGNSIGSWKSSLVTKSGMKLLWSLTRWNEIGRNAYF